VNAKTATPRQRGRLSDAEREQRRAADREFVQQAVDALRSSAGWQRWLQSRRHFHTYSLRNQLLIAVQCPHATHVAGFKAWLLLGYCVRKGERALRIWAPCPPSRAKLEAWQRAGADPDERPRTYFKLSPVFDRSQVEPLPPPAEPVPLDPPGLRDVDGDELAPWKPALEQLAGELGSTVSYEPIPGSASGSYDLETRAIRVDPGRPTNAQVKTLIHELAHALVRADRQDDDPELDRAAEELVAETVAYSVCASGRIDTGDYSITYLASWAERRQTRSSAPPR
jgi:N-terminal domain of anti-restriction factor ArdC